MHALFFTSRRIGTEKHEPKAVGFPHNTQVAADTVAKRKINATDEERDFLTVLLYYGTLSRPCNTDVRFLLSILAVCKLRQNIRQ